jgi:hypothetical protein
MQIPLASQSKALIWNRSLAVMACSNPAAGKDVCLCWMLCVLQVRASAKHRSVVQRSPTERVCERVCEHVCERVCERVCQRVCERVCDQVQQ